MGTSENGSSQFQSDTAVVLTPTQIAQQQITPQRAAQEIARGSNATATFEQRLSGNASSQFLTPEGTESTVARPFKEKKIIGIESQFEPNILSVYENSIYNFRLFLSSENADHANISAEDIIVVAETGSTGFNITNVNIANSIAPTSNGLNAFIDKVSFSIIEPHGSKLLDQIRNAALRLQVFNHRAAPFWLELTFKGYSPGGNTSHEGGLPSETNDDISQISSKLKNFNLNELQFLWKINLQTVNIEMNKGGTEYQFKAIAHQQQALRNDARKLEKNESIEAATLSDYFTELAKRLNRYDNYSIRSLVDTNKRVRQYAFAFPGGEFADMPMWQINNPEDDKFSAIRNSDPFPGTIEDAKNKKDKRKKKITFSSDSSMETIIQELIGTTLQGQSLAIYGDKNRITGDAGDKNFIRDVKTPSVIFMVEPIVDIISYNALAKKYNILITYHIKPFSTFKPLISKEQIRNYEEKQSKELIDAIRTSSNLKKRYDYMFTGLNTEILDYRIDFRHAWFAPLPMFQGQKNPSVSASTRNMSPKKAAEQVKQKSNPEKKTENSLKKFTKEELLGVRNELTDFDQDIQLTATEFTLLERVRRELDRRATGISISSKRINTSSFGSSSRVIRLKNDLTSAVQTPVKKNNKDDNLSPGVIIGAKKVRAEVAERSAQLRDNPGLIFFVEDFEKKSVETKTIQELEKEITSLGIELGGGQQFQIGNVETTTKKGRAYFNAIMNQMYWSGDMINLELTIRGDPYWLGEPDPRKRIAGSKGKDLTDADTNILITFGFPVSFDDGGPGNNQASHEGSGLVNLENKQNGINGLYRVITIESEFSGGKFTQKLKGNINPIAKEQDVLQFFTRDNI